MDLNAALSIATSGLEGTQYALGVLSQNVANSSTTGYVEENAQLSARSSSGTGSGLKIGITTRNVDDALQANLYSQNAAVQQQTVLDNSLSAITALQGSTSATTDSSDATTSGQTGTLSDDLGNLSNDFANLVSTPTDDSARSSVLSDANTLVTAVNTMSSAYQTQRQSAEDAVGTDLSSINTDLTTIGQISQQIVALKVSGASVADLENQRAQIMSDLSSKVSVTFTETSKGDMLVKTADGLQLPTTPDSGSSVTIPTSDWPLTTSSITLSPTSTYSADPSTTSIPGIMLNGKDVTGSLTGGSLGANIQLRDDIYPTMQAQLDAFSYTLANRFQSAGLALFTGADGVSSVESDATKGTADGGTVGLSSVLTVSKTYSDDPSLLSPDGDTTLAQTILSQTFGSASADVSGSLQAPNSNLGVSGTISTGYSATLSLANLATALTASQAQVAASATASLSTATTIQTSLATKVSNVSGVNVDNEMSNVVSLQNAYAANAKVVSAVQAMFTALMDAV